MRRGSLTGGPEHGAWGRRQVTGAVCLHRRRAPAGAPRRALIWDSQCKWGKEKGLHCKETNQGNGGSQQNPKHLLHAQQQQRNALPLAGACTAAAAVNVATTVSRLRRRPSLQVPAHSEGDPVRAQSPPVCQRRTGVELGASRAPTPCTVPGTAHA